MTGDDGQMGRGRGCRLKMGSSQIVTVGLSQRVSLKPDRKTADKSAKINSDGRASCMTARPHTMSSVHQTVTLLATVAWARVSGLERIQEAQLSLTNRAMLVCKVVEVSQDFL